MRSTKEEQQCYRVAELAASSKPAHVQFGPQLCPICKGAGLKAMTLPIEGIIHNCIICPKCGGKGAFRL